MSQELRKIRYSIPIMKNRKIRAMTRLHSECVRVSGGTKTHKLHQNFFTCFWHGFKSQADMGGGGVKHHNHSPRIQPCTRL